ncbi:potassium two pore domain channel sandman isoform X2 [Arctopsyche grandis]
MFIAIEAESARDLTSDVLLMRNQVANRLWDLTCCQVNVFNDSAWFDYVAHELLEYQSNIIKAVKNGYDGIDDAEESKQWRFSGAFLYSLTVITTIGYGNIAPRTKWGKVTTILYAIIGMPLFLLYLSNIGDILARSFKWSYAMCCLCRGCPGVARRRAERVRIRTSRNQVNQSSSVIAEYRGSNLGSRPPSVHVEMYEDNGILGGGRAHVHAENDNANSEEDEDEDDEGESEVTLEDYDPQTVTVPITLCLAIMVGYILFGAALFGRWESWDSIDGSYFCFISLSSIGFGDIVPGDKIYAAKEIDLSFIFCSMYLMLGMALIAMCFNLMQEQVIAIMGVAKRGLKNILRCKR